MGHPVWGMNEKRRSKEAREPISPLLLFSASRSNLSQSFDATVTQVMGDRFGKVMSWYDNEWGFSNRMIDLAQLVASKL